MKPMTNLKPYFETDLGQLYHGDCLEIMRTFEDKSFDLVLTDPPYGIGCDGGSYGYGNCPSNYEKMDWDKHPPPKEIFDLIIKRPAIIFGGNYFADKLPIVKGWIVWDKIGGQKLKNPFSKAELIWTNLKGTTDIVTFIQQGFIKQTKDTRYHPTQKPTELIIQLIRKANIEGCILDPFLGSGTTAIACEKLGRKWIGIEISEKYCETAAKRIDAEAKQGKLF